MLPFFSHANLLIFIEVYLFILINRFICLGWPLVLACRLSSCGLWGSSSCDIGDLKFPNQGSNVFPLHWKADS